MLPFPIPALPKWAWYAIGIALAALALWLLLDAYGDSRYREGKKDEAAAWQAASDKLLAKAAEAETEADKRDAARAADYAAEVAEEKERIDHAIQEGSSPMDVLFGGNRS